ncbi:hypothetical protein ABT186_46940 [Streptomyces sp. NPDC001634]|uniref:hypothetical protein n=1 Tax=Streptomyces sp. NPDC001634 TaxID=3154390 RepID=UPI003320744E
MPAPAHVLTAPPAVTETELDLARWEDDGGPAVEPRPGPQAPHWLRIAAALGERLPELAEREDVIVTCEHGTRSGAPAAFYPVTAQLEIDAGLFAPLYPATIDPTRVGDEENYPVAWGAFTTRPRTPATACGPRRRRCAARLWMRQLSSWRNPGPSTPTLTAARATAGFSGPPYTPWSWRTSPAPRPPAGGRRRWRPG